MLSYNSYASLKAKAVTLAEHHRDADMLVTGTFGKESRKSFKACSVGCFLYDLRPDSWEDTQHKHSAVATDLCLPEWLIRLQDDIFEGLGAHERNNFHVELFKNIPVGVNLEPVRHLIAIDRFQRLIIQQTAAIEANLPDDVKACIRDVVDLLVLSKQVHQHAVICNFDITPSLAYSVFHRASSLGRAYDSFMSHNIAHAMYAAGNAAWSVGVDASSLLCSKGIITGLEYAVLAEFLQGATSVYSAVCSSSHFTISLMGKEEGFKAGWRAERDSLFKALDTLNQPQKGNTL